MGIQINGATDSITAIDGTIDVVSAIGNAGVVTATAFVGNITGNVTGNINHASTLELQTGGVTRAHFNSSGHFGIAGITTISHTGANQLTIKDSDTSGNGSSMRISFKDSGNTERFYIGNDESSNSYLYLGSPSGQNNNVALTVGGSTKLTAFSGGIGVNGDLELQDTIYHAGDTDTKIRFPAADTVTVETAGSERLRINSSGNARIGGTSDTTDQGYRLTLQGSSNATYLQFFDNGTGTTHGSDGSFIGLINQDFYVWNREVEDVVFGSSNNERLRINSGGQVLVGTATAPAYANRRFTVYDSTNSGTCSLEIRGSSSGSSRLYFTSSTTAGQLGAYAGKVYYGHADNVMAFYTAGNERLRITSGGNVEIGSGAGTGSDFSLLDGMVINTANGSAGLIINSSSSSHNAYMSFGYGSGSGTSHHDQFSAYIGRVGDNNLIFGTNNSIRASIDSNGNFNLGLSSTPVNSSTEQGVYLAGADSTQSVISSNVTPFVVNRMGTGGNDRNCIEFRNNGSLKGTVGAVGVNNGIFFQSGVTEVMRITNDYKILVGLTTTGTSTSNNNLELAGTKMLKVGQFYIGYVIGTGNNGSGTLVLHKMGQNVGLQFSGMVTCHSYTGSAYLSGCIVVRYNTDAVTRDVTLQKAQSGMNFQIVSGTISGESGTYFGIKKNAGGTGSFYINAFVGGNIESYGGIREVSNSDWTTTTVHGSGIT